MAATTATSARNIVAGSGTVGATAGSRILTFSASQNFKEGATVVLDPSGTPQYFSIDVGADKSWQALQAATATVSGKSFNTTDQTPSRNRGGVPTGISGTIIPGAMHFLYRAALDASSNPDWFFYFDTVFPENGVHPYTRDQYTGTSWVGSTTSPAPALVPNLGLRIRVLEGILRGNPATYNGGTSVPDTRLQDLVNRVYALEQWAHGGSLPPVGTNASYTVDQLQSYGDIA